MNWAIDLAKTHVPKEGQANVYGVIIYTDANANVIKALNDPVYFFAYFLNINLTA